MTSQDIKRLNRRRAALVGFAVLMILIGLGMIVANPKIGLTVGSIWILIFGILPLVVAIRSGKKVPPESADFIASDRRSFAVFSSWYWINDKGIWKDNKLLYTWSEIKDIQILRTWVESRTKARTFTVADAALNQGPDAVVYGVVRVFLNDGRSFELNNVVDPERVVNYIKNVYLKKQ